MPADPLHPQEHLTLALSILEEHGVLGYRNHEAFLDLLNGLKGHELSLRVILPALKEHTPDELLGLIGLRDHDPVRESALRTSIEHIYGDISPDARQWYLSLAPFRASLNRSSLQSYVDAVARLPIAEGCDLRRWEDYLDAAVDAGLLVPVATGAPLLHIHNAFAFVLNLRFGSHLPPEEQRALRRAHMEHMRSLMTTYLGIMEADHETEAEFGLMLCQQEMQNVHAALQTALDVREDIVPFAKYLTSFFDLVGEQDAPLRLLEEVLEKMERYDPADLKGAVGLGYISVMQSLADRYASTPQAPRSRALYQKALEQYDQLESLAPRGKARGRATLYHEMGTLELYQGELNEAERYFERSLELKRECEDRLGQLSAYVVLARLAHHNARWDEARAHYQCALEIAVEQKMEDEQGDIRREWGECAIDQGDWNTAEAHFTAALDIYTRGEDGHAQATCWHQLGTVAQLRNDYRQASRYYEKALEFFTKKEEDHHAKAVTLHQLGVIALEDRDFQQSKQRLFSALEAFKGCEDGENVQLTIKNLARLAERSGDRSVMDEAGKMLDVRGDDLARWAASQ